MTRHRIRIVMTPPPTGRGRAVAAVVALLSGAVAVYCASVAVRLVLDFHTRETYTDGVVSSVFIGGFVGFAIASTRICLPRLVAFWRSFR